MVKVDGLMRNVATSSRSLGFFWLFKILMVHILTFFVQWLHEYIISKHLEEN